MQRMAHSLSKALDLWLQQMVAREQLPAQTKKQVFVIGSLHIQYATSVHKLSAEGNEELYSEATSAALSMALSELLESKAGSIECLIFLKIIFWYSFCFSAFTLIFIFWECGSVREFYKQVAPNSQLLQQSYHIC